MEVKIEKSTIFAATFTVALLVALVPVWGVAWLPMGDLGGWIELLDVMARIDDPHTLYADTYFISSLTDPGALTLWFGAAAGPLLSADIVAKILVSFYVVATPLSVLALCVASRRSGWLALLAVPMVYNALFNTGLLNNLVAMPFLLLSVALARAFGERGTAKLGVLLATSLVFLYFAHAFVFLMGWAICALILLLNGVACARKPLRLVPLTAPLPLFGIWFHDLFIARRATEEGATFVSDRGFEFVFQSPIERIDQAWHWSLSMFRTPADDVFGVVVGTLWVSLVAVGIVQMVRGRNESPRPTFIQLLGQWSIEIATLCCVVAYFVLPSHMSQLDLIAERVPAVIVMLLVTWPRTDPAPTRPIRWLLAAPMVLVALSWPLAVLEGFQRFEREVVAGLPGAIADLPERTWMSYVRLDSSNPVTHRGPTWHIPKAIHAVHNGGLTDDSFAVRPYTPIQYQPGKTPGRLDADYHKDIRLHDYDYLLIYSPDEHAPAGISKLLDLVFHDRSWWLYRVTMRTGRDIAFVQTTHVGGGQRFYARCDGARRLIGISGFVSRRSVLSASPKCSPVSGASPVTKAGLRPTKFKPLFTHKPLASKVVHDPTNSGKKKAKAAPKLFKQNCDADEVVVGLHGHRKGVITSLGLVCAASESPSETRRIPAKGRARGEPFELMCPVGFVATGLHGFRGLLLDSLGLLCEPP